MTIEETEGVSKINGDRFIFVPVYLLYRLLLVCSVKQAFYIGFYNIMYAFACLA